MNKIKIELLENEEWKDVEGYEGDYSVSNMGRVYSWISRKLMKGFNKSGYLYVELFKNRESCNKSIHSLVLKNFTLKEEWKTFPNHLDFDRHNNKLNNLEWVTHGENLLHRIKHKGSSILVGIEKAKEIRNMYCNAKLSELKISKIYKVNTYTIHRIVQNQTYYDENYTPPNRKFKNGYSDELIKNMKDMYYVYGLGSAAIANFLNLNKSYVYSAITKYHKHLD